MSSAASDGQTGSTDAPTGDAPTGALTERAHPGRRPVALGAAC